jgi:hypothetical protein
MVEDEPDDANAATSRNCLRQRRAPHLAIIARSRGLAVPGVTGKRLLGKSRPSFS